MPLPMVHLSIAHRLVERYGDLPSPAFYLGSVAPDAIHVRPGTDRRDKLAVHLVGEDGLDEERLRVLLAGHGQTPEGAALITGYAAHVLADVHWRQDLIGSFRARHEVRLQQGKMSVAELRALYYAECDKVDLDLYDLQPWRPEVWTLLRAAQARDLDGLLSAGEIAGWRDRVLSWFEENRHKAEYEPQYLTLERVLTFIDDTTERVQEKLAESAQ